MSGQTRLQAPCELCVFADQTIYHWVGTLSRGGMASGGGTIADEGPNVGQWSALVLGLYDYARHCADVGAPRWLTIKVSDESVAKAFPAKPSRYVFTNRCRERAEKILAQIRPNAFTQWWSVVYIHHELNEAALRMVQPAGARL